MQFFGYDFYFSRSLANMSRSKPSDVVCRCRYFRRRVYVVVPFSDYKYLQGVLPLC